MAHIVVPIMHPFMYCEDIVRFGATCSHVLSLVGGVPALHSIAGDFFRLRDFVIDQYEQEQNRRILYEDSSEVSSMSSVDPWGGVPEPTSPSYSDY